MKLLWIPHDTWVNPQRARYFCKHLSEDFEVHVFDFISFTRPHDYFSKKLPQSWIYNQREKNGITIHRVPRLSPSIFSSKLRSINYKIAERFINKIVRKNDIEVIIGTSIVKPPKARKLIFDLFDDNPAYWREFKQNFSLANEIENIEKDFLRVSDEVVVVSQVLQDNVSRETTLVPNGFDRSRIIGGDAAKLKETFDIDGKIVGVIGNHGEFSGLVKVAEAANVLQNQDVHFLIAGGGSEIPKTKEIAKKYNLKNITFLGYIEEVSDFFAAIDVGLIPFAKYRFTDSASPIKLFEYTAAGVPVVSTDLEEIIRLDFSNVTLVGDSAIDLAEGIKNAIDNRPRFPDMKKYEWQNLAKEFKKTIES